MIALSNKLDGRPTVLSFWLRGTRREGLEPVAEVRSVRSGLFRRAHWERFEGAFGDVRLEWEVDGESERVSIDGEEAVRVQDERFGLRRESWSFDVLVGGVRTRGEAEHRTWVCDRSGVYRLGGDRDEVRVWRHRRGLRMICADRVFLEHGPAIMVGVSSMVLMRWSVSLHDDECGAGVGRVVRAGARG